MSGIAGTYYLDGQPADSNELRAMLDRLAHRGPDGSDIWQENAVGMGHCALQTTPEARYEHFPMTSRCGNFVLTADARIDNRVELIAALRPEHRNGHSVTDGELILAAYAKWGEDCPTYLLGDFAFSVWDRLERKLFCARDHFGVKPFYYYAGSNKFIFSSEIKALWEIADVEPRINETRIGDFLADILPDAQSTFFHDVYRLPAGHRMRVDVRGVDVSAYYTLADSVRPLEPGRKDYAETLREIFAEAVKCRLRSTTSVGAMLSGGLDSSSIAAIARDELLETGRAPLRTYSNVYDEHPECDERRYIQAIVDWKEGMQPHFIVNDRPRNLEELEHLIESQDEPFFAPGGSLDLYNEAARHGVRVLLDGHGGDEVVSTGFGRLRELAVAGNWITLSRELKKLSGAYGERFVPSLIEYLNFAAKARPQKTSLRITCSALRRLGSIPRRAGTDQARTTWNDLVADEFAAAIALGDRVRKFREHHSHEATSEAERHLAILDNPLRAGAFEVLDRFSAHSSVETRYPFYDKRLVEFCLALPSDQKLADGFTRVVMRRAMKNLLPDEVLWRRDKTTFTAYIREMHAAYYREMSLPSRGSSIVYKFVNRSVLDEITARMLQNEKTTAWDVSLLHKCLVLNLWLKRNTADELQEHEALAA